MLVHGPGLDVHDDHVGGHYERSQAWNFPLGRGQRLGTFVRLGDGDRGPVVFFFAMPPGAEQPLAPAHAHASDNWRMSLKGMQPMGPDRYGPGEFRFQEGWKPYGSDGPAAGPDGGWGVIVFGDSRGVRTRPVKPTTSSSSEALAAWTGLTGDLVSDDHDRGPGPSALASSVGVVKSSHLDGSFGAASTWGDTGNGSHIITSLLGAPDTGPVMVLAVVEPGATSTPELRADSELLRLVVGGSCSVDGEAFGPGQLRVHRSGRGVSEVVAGADGLQEMVLLADRRAGWGHLSTEGWTTSAAGSIAALQDRLLGG